MANNNINILVVEDDGDINSLICNLLMKKGYNVRGAFSGTEAKLCLEMFDYHLILLDLMLPGITGEELIAEIRKIKKMPIIVISAKTTQNDKINVLKIGADDFVSKPFDVNEVFARVDAQLRRYTEFSHGNEDDNNILRYKDLIVDRVQMEIRVKDTPITCTAKEFSIIELFVGHPKKVFTRANLFEHVWGEKFFGDDNTVNVHISNARSKIAMIDNENEYIKTVWGIGFKLAD